MKKVLFMIFILAMLTACSQAPQGNDAFAYNNMGAYHAEEGEYAKAEEFFLKALELNPESENTRKNLALVYFRQAKFDEAEYHLSILVEEYPDNPSYHYDLAVALAENCRYNDVCDLDRATAEFAKAEEISPGFENAQENVQALQEVKESLE